MLDSIQKLLATMCDLDRVRGSLGLYIDQPLGVGQGSDVLYIHTQMLSGIATVPTKDDIPTARRLIDVVILLKTFLHLLPGLVDELGRLLPPVEPDQMDTEEQGPNDTLLLKAIIETLSHPVSVITPTFYIRCSGTHVSPMRRGGDYYRLLLRSMPSFKSSSVIQLSMRNLPKHVDCKNALPFRVESLGFLTLHAELFYNQLRMCTN